MLGMRNTIGLALVCSITACGEVIPIPGYWDASPFVAPDAPGTSDASAQPDAQTTLDAASAQDGSSADAQSGPCAPVAYDFTASGASGETFQLFHASLRSSDVLVWSDSGFGSSPGTMALEPGETITIEWVGQSVGDIHIAWSSPETMRIGFTRWDGTQGPGRIPAAPEIRLVGPLRAITLSALDEQYLTTLEYCAY